MIQIYESVPEIEGKDCRKEDDEVAEELDSDAEPPVGHVADQHFIRDGLHGLHRFICHLIYFFHLM